MTHSTSSCQRVSLAIIVLVALVCSVPSSALGGRVGPQPRGSVAFGIINPISPPAFAPPPTLGVYHVATAVHVNSMSGQPGPWFVQVRTASGTVVAMGLTGASGDISLGLPLGPGLVLDVIGTDAVDVPVAAGQSVLVLIN